MDLSILIVTYRSAGHIRACLDSLRRQTLARHRFEIIVVDNSSTDATTAIIANEYPEVRLIRADGNLGFTGGNNLAKRFARGRRLLLLNPDTIADPHALDELLRVDAERAVAKLVLSPDGRMINSGGTVLLRSGWAADDGFRDIDRGQFEAERNAIAGCGAALLIPNAPGTIFPADYFTYYEDVAVGWQAAARGTPTRLASRAVVMHCCGAGGSEDSPHVQYSTQRNRLVATQTYADPFLALVATLKFTMSALLRPNRARVRAWWSVLARLPKTLVERYDARSTRAPGVER